MSKNLIHLPDYLWRKIQATAQETEMPEIIIVEAAIWHWSLLGEELQKGLLDQYLDSS